MRKLIILLLCCTSLYAVEKHKIPVDKKYVNKISSGQGLREMILLEESNISFGGRWHQGLDFALPYGTPVYASMNGVVKIVYPGKGNNTDKIKWKGHEIYGACIVIEHEDCFTLYAHLSTTAVITNTEVKQGQLIAYSGGTGQASGQSTGNHLHWSIYPKLVEAIDFGNEEN